MPPSLSNLAFLIKLKSPPKMMLSQSHSSITVINILEKMGVVLLWSCCDSRDNGDPDRLPRPVSDSRHDSDTTEPNAPNAPRLIYLARWNTKTNKQRRTATFLSIHF